MWGVSGVTVRHDDRVAIEDVTLELEPGQLGMVVGGDGAGKSTLCKLLVGLVAAQSGRVRVPSPIGYLPDGSGVWGDLTVVENLELVASANRLAPDDRRSRIAQLLDDTGLAEAADRLADDLSGGMRQKLGLAAAVLPRPDLVVLDEPSTGLDPVSRSDLAGIVSRLLSQGLTVVSTTTYLAEAILADRVLVLEAGRPLASGSIEEILASVPGAVGAPADPSPGPLRWRRGEDWRAWFPDGVMPPGATAVTPDLDDVIMVAALARRRSDEQASR